MQENENFKIGKENVKKEYLKNNFQTQKAFESSSNRKIFSAFTKLFMWEKADVLFQSTKIFSFIKLKQILYPNNMNEIIYH